MKRFAIVVTVIVAIACAALTWLLTVQAEQTVRPSLEGLDSKTATIAGNQLEVYLAVTSEQRTTGLSHTKVLPTGSGMLFDMQRKGILSIWMKDMHFAIDIIWLDEQLKVVHIEHQVSPDTYPTTFKNPAERPASYVLEINGGQANALGIELGSQLTL